MNAPLDTTHAPIAPDADAKAYVEQMLRDDPIAALDWFAGRAFATGRQNIAATLFGITQLCSRMKQP